MANEEDKTEDELIEGLELDNNDTASPDDNEESLENNTKEENTVDEEIIDDTSINVQKKQKNVKKIIVIAAGALLSIILLVVILYFVGIFDSEPIETEPIKAVTTEVKDIKSEMPIVPEKPKYKFKIKDIDKNRLNKKLSFLTKHELAEEVIKKPQEVITENHEIEKKIEESKIKSGIVPANEKTIEPVKDKIIEEKTIEEKFVKENTSEDKIKQNPTDTKDDIEIISVKESEKNTSPIKEETQEFTNTEKTIEKDEEKVIPKIMEEKEFIKKEDIDKIVTSESESEKIDEDKNNTKIEPKEDSITSLTEEEGLREENNTESNILNENTSKEKTFLKFAQIATIKKNLYLSFLHQLKDIDNRISVCRNDINYIQIFVGPFQNNEERKEALHKINSSIVKDAFAIDFTQEEFNKRCNF